MSKRSGPGSGWVIAEFWDPIPADLVEKYCAQYARNVLVRLSATKVFWRRDPDDKGHGVANGSQVADFRRMVSNALTHPEFPVSTILARRPAGKNWEPRVAFQDLYDILKNGWQATEAETLDDVAQVMTKMRLNIEIDNQGNVTGIML
jgi:hypothetical protein